MPPKMPPVFLFNTESHIKRWERERVGTDWDEKEGKMEYSSQKDD